MGNKRKELRLSNNTPDFAYLQVLDDQARDRVGLHYLPGGIDHELGQYGTATPYSAIYSNIYPALPRCILHMKFQGKLVQAKIEYQTKQPRQRHTRGEIHDFSKQSRGRLLDLFHTLEVKRKPIFVTLTYARGWPDARTAKNHLRALFKRVERKLEGQRFSAVWRMEFQERGAPHFHIIFFDLPFIYKLTWQYWWEEITGSPEPFTRVERLNNTRHMMSYVSKYVAKVDKQDEKTGFNSPTYLAAYVDGYDDLIGRLWGYYNKSALPFAELTEFEVPLDRRGYYLFRQAAAQKFPPISEYLSEGFRLYVRDAALWLDLFHRLYDVLF